MKNFGNILLILVVAYTSFVSSSLVAQNVVTRAALCSSGRQAMEAVCPAQCRQSQIAVDSKECKASCQFTKKYFFSRCDFWPTNQVKTLLKTICEYVHYYGYKGDFSQHCGQLQNKGVKNNLCKDGEKAMDSICKAMCKKSNLEYDSQECKGSCQFTKSYFFSNCNQNDKEEINEIILPAVCPYLYSFGYKGLFLEYCQNILIKNAWVEEFCQKGNQALKAGCYKECTPSEKGNGCAHCENAGDEIFGLGCLMQPENDLRQRMNLFCQMMVSESGVKEEAMNGFVAKYCS